MAKKKAKKIRSGKVENKKPKKIVKPKVSKPIVPFYAPGFWKANWWKALIIFAIPFLLYFQSTQFGYVLDDQIVITENNFTKKGFAGIGDLMTTESMTGYFGEQRNLVQGNRYRPWNYKFMFCCNGW